MPCLVQRSWSGSRYSWQAPGPPWSVTSGICGLDRDPISRYHVLQDLPASGTAKEAKPSFLGSGEVMLVECTDDIYNFMFWYEYAYRPFPAQFFDGAEPYQFCAGAAVIPCR